MLIRFFFFFFFLYRLVLSLSNQEDLTIPTYFHIGCLLLNPDKEFISNDIQENSSGVYQTFSSSNLTVELCFRLCRRWIVLLNNNHTNCICLYTMNALYEINEHLGRISSINNCTSNTLQIYSLTKDPYLLTPPSSSPNDEWSIEGCYYLNGIQNFHANRSFNDINFTQAIDSCRTHCQSIDSPTYFSFFVSLKKLCYCLPIKVSPSVKTIAVRKPLIHCSFLSYIKNGFENSFNVSEINADTVIKINVERYCSSSFTFNRNLYICYKTVPYDISSTFWKVNSNEICSPVLIKTAEQWNYFISLPAFSRTRTLVWINRNSTYIFDDLFKSKQSLLPSNNLCLVINGTQLLSFDLVLCATQSSQDNIFCSQKPSESVGSDHAEFKSM